MANGPASAGPASTAPELLLEVVELLPELLPIEELLEALTLVPEEEVLPVLVATEDDAVLSVPEELERVVALELEVEAVEDDAVPTLPEPRA